MDQDELKKDLKSVIEKNMDITIDDFDENLQSSGKMDSYTLVMLVMHIEDHHGVKLDLENIDFNTTNSINKFADLVFASQETK